MTGLDPTPDDAARWLPIPGYEGRYEVSDRGEIRSVARMIRCGTGMTWREGAVLSPWDLRGYRRVRLCGETGKVNIFVHRAVALAFIGEPPAPGMHVMHLNDDPADNRVENLAWGTASDNERHKVEAGRQHEVAKTECPRGHPLRQPNLIPHRFERLGQRACLACERARGWCSRRSIPFDPEVADAKYQQIILEGAVA